METLLLCSCFKTGQIFNAFLNFRRKILEITPNYIISINAVKTDVLYDLISKSSSSEKKFHVTKLEYRNSFILYSLFIR